MNVTDEGIDKWASEVHPQKMLFPIEVVEGGKFIWARDEQLLNTLFPNDVTEDGIDIFSSFVHSLKVASLIEFTEHGIEIWIRFEQLEKQNSPI